MDGDTLWHKPVPAEQAKALIDVAENHDLRLNFYLDDTWSSTASTSGWSTTSISPK